MGYDPCCLATQWKGEICDSSLLTFCWEPLGKFNQSNYLDEKKTVLVIHTGSATRLYLSDGLLVIHIVGFDFYIPPVYTHTEAMAGI